MNQLLTQGQVLKVNPGDFDCRVEAFLGGGAQGEVYRATIHDAQHALKWYFPDQTTRAQLDTLRDLVQRGAPTDKFLWPTGVVISDSGFGYVMPLRDERFCGMADLMRGRVKTSSRAVATAGYHLANSFKELHANGLAYCDISFGNVFIDFDCGDIRICDNDNVTPSGTNSSRVLGTQRFMAPEIVCGTAVPDDNTDRYSLAVLLFFMFFLNHPLEGRRETQIRALDMPAMNKLYGTEPLFIFDPNDDSNEPTPEYHRPAINHWSLYPSFFKNLFVKSFTGGLRDAQHGRVRESEWSRALLRLLDSIVVCPNCSAANFYDSDTNVVVGDTPGACWRCKAPIPTPIRLKLEDESTVVLNPHTALVPRHLSPRSGELLAPELAKVVPHPTIPNVFGLENLSSGPWTAITSNGTNTILPGKRIALVPNTMIQFGEMRGEILGA